MGRWVDKCVFSKDLGGKEDRISNIRTSWATCPAETPLSHQQCSCLLSNPTRGDKSQGVQAGSCQPTRSIWATLLGYRLRPWGFGSCRALGETGQTCSRHGAKGPPSQLRKKRRVFTPMCPQPHDKWQHMAAPWGMASSGPSFHSPVLLGLLLVLRGKYLAKN